MSRLPWFRTAEGRRRATAVVALRGKGLKEQEIAAKLGLHISTVSLYLKRTREVGIESVEEEQE